jgi:serine/threonine-protein kinase
MVSQLGCVSREELQAFVLGDLPEPQSRAVAVHLENCPSCEAIAASLDDFTDPILRSLRRACGQAASTSPEDTQDSPFRAATPDVGHVPQQVGRYEVLRELGRGGMSVVYEARQARPARLVALKMILAGEYAGADRRARFLAEADAIARLQHPNIVQVHEVGDLEGVLFFSMELMQGGSLHERLAGAPQPSRQAAALVEALARAIHYAHERGVVHRDLKPANVLLTAEGTPKVADFGLARLEQTEGMQQAGLTASGVIVGTPSYMAPEQAAGKSKEVGPAADIYALGAVLYECLTGRPPFRAETPLDTLAQVVAEEPVSPRRLNAKVPCDLETICLKCLHKEPHKRYPTAAEMADDLQRFQQGEPVRARPVALPERCWRWCRRNPALAAVAAAVLLVALAAAGGVALWQRQRQQADSAVNQALAEARLLLQQARAAPPGDTARFAAAVAAAQQAQTLAGSAAVSAAVRRQTEDLAELIGQEADAATLDGRLLAALLEVRGPREGPRFRADDRGLLTVLTEPSADEQFASAFADWGLNVDATATAQAAARLRQRPAAVRTEVVAALDEWAAERRRQRRPAAAVKRLTDLAEAVDEPDSRRRELRALLAGGNLERERAVAVLVMALRPVPVPVDAGWGPDRERLRRLAARTNAATEPVLGLLTLVRSLAVAGEQALAERLLRAALRARPQEVVLYQTLGQMLERATPPRWAQAAECYTAARALRSGLGDSLAAALIGAGRAQEGLELYQQLTADNPGNPWLHSVRGSALSKQGKHKEAEAAYREAIRLKPDYPEAHDSLGITLYNQRRLKEAEAAIREAIRLRPDYPLAHNNLGVALAAQRRQQEAVTAFRKAIRLKPDSPTAHTNLGTALNGQGRHKEAESVHREAIRLKPDWPQAHYNLGNALSGQRRHKEAEAAIREAIRLKPDYPTAHNNLGNVLGNQGRYKEAEAAYRQAIRLEPDLPQAHNNLGSALNSQRRHKEAEAAFREAIRLNPDYPRAHNNLGNVLGSQGRHKEAEAACRQAILLEPDLPEAHCNLGVALLLQGRFPQALAALRQGDTLGRKTPGWRYPSEPWVRRAERMVELDRRLPAVCSGQSAPASAAECLEFATLCRYPARRMHAAAARLSAHAFAAEPRLADDLSKQSRYYAARSAALAASGQAEDAKLVPDKLALALRRQALAYLRAELALYTKLARSDDPRLKQGVRQRLLQWRADADLASLREPAALARLDEDERDAWRQLWTLVDTLSKQLEVKK